MPIVLHKTADFGAAKAAVTTWGYRLYDAAAGTYAARVTAGIVRTQDPAGNYTGAVSADVTIPDGFRGKIVWDSGEVLTPVPQAEEEINLVLVPPTAADVWAAPTRTLTAFAFPVTVAANNDKAGYALATPPPTAAQVRDAVLAGTPLPRDVSAVTAPTVADCLVAAFCGAAGAEAVAGTTYTVRQPDGTSVFRAFVLDSATAPTSRT